MAVRRILATEFRKDILSGLRDEELMKKYRLSEAGLADLFRKLVDKGIVTQSDLDARLTESELLAGLSDERRAQRNFLLFEIPVYDAWYNRMVGRLQDITESGVGIRGGEFAEGEGLLMEIESPNRSDYSPFKLETECRWRRKEDDGTFTSGFKITKITDGALTELRKLIDSYASTEID